MYLIQGLYSDEEGVCQISWSWKTHGSVAMCLLFGNTSASRHNSLMATLTLLKNASFIWALIGLHTAVSPERHGPDRRSQHSLYPCLQLDIRVT